MFSRASNTCVERLSHMFHKLHIKNYYVDVRKENAHLHTQINMFIVNIIQLYGFFKSFLIVTSFYLLVHAKASFKTIEVY